MKKLEVIIRPEKLEAIKNIINSYSVGGMTVFSVMGCGVQKGDVSEPGRELHGLKITGMNLIPKIQINTVVNDDVVDDMLLTIHEKISSGRVGDGKVFVYSADDAMRIRTGERGIKSL